VTRRAPGSRTARIVVAIDGWKGTLTSLEAGRAVARGLSSTGAAIEVVAVSDGGEGLIEAFRSALGGRIVRARCRGPLMEEVDAGFLVLDDSRAVVEMAASSGLPLVPAGRRNPLLTTSWGVGDQIRAAMDSGSREIVVGVGGSATCDGGIGMAAALGARFLDSSGAEVPSSGGALTGISRIDVSGMDPRIPDRTVRVACDVTSPLLGDAGAARVFGPQKGASAADVEVLEVGMAGLADLLERDIGVDVRVLEGGGAAGGLAAGLAAFCGARLERGFDLVARAVGLGDRIARADLVVTGEGSMDAQTLVGKLPSGVARLAAAHGVPVVAFCGRVAARQGLEPDPFDRIHDLESFAGSVEASMAGGAALLERFASERAEDVIARASSRTR
jgi:glycerate kinase